jgi:hypothetical protein
MATSKKKIPAKVWVPLTVAVLALIGVIYTTERSRSKPAITQTSTSGSNINVPGDSNHINSINAGAGSAVSIGQTGGINAVNFNLQINLFLQGNPTRAAKGFIYSVDTARKTIHFRPKSGQWDTPCVAIPLAEKDSVQAHFGAESNPSLAVTPALLPIKGDTLYSQSITSPATANSGYFFHYVKRPTTFYFGSQNGPLYQASFGK